MKCYILLPRFTPDLPPFPAGTRAYSDPTAALAAAQDTGAPIILQYAAAVRNGRTVKELDPRRPAKAYKTRRTVVQDNRTAYRLVDTNPDEPCTDSTSAATAHSITHRHHHSATGQRSAWSRPQHGTAHSTQRRAAPP